jgi:hypothetical protein
MPNIAELNSHAFDWPLSKEAAYWVGFLLADGCIATRKGLKKDYHSVVLGLKGSDAFHIEKFRKFLESSAKITEKYQKTNYGEAFVVSIVVTNQELCDRLADYGIIPRKTYLNVGCDPRLQNSPDFWRGVVDGDGTVALGKKGPLIKLGGSENLVKNFSDLCGDLTGFWPRVGDCRSIKVTGFGSFRAAKVIRWLYYDGCVALDRKLKSALDCIEWESEALKPKEKRTHCRRGHPFDEENTFMSPQRGRGCRACRKISFDKRKLKLSKVLEGA